MRGGHSRRLSRRHPYIFFLLLTFAVAQSKRVLAWMNQPPIGLLVTDAYDSLHLHSCTHVHNMNLTDTIDTNCHRSYSSYCNEYLFDTATNKQRTLSTQTVTDRTVPTVTNTCSTLLQTNNGSTCTSWTPTEHTFIKSQSQQRISHFLSTCNLFAHNLQSTCSL